MTTAIIGAGVMGESILAGLLRAGHDPATVLVGEKRAERAAELTARYGVRVLANREAAAGASTVLLVVKPGDLVGVLDEVADTLNPGVLVVSLAAGVTLATIEARLPAGVSAARVMPNTPALIGEGMAALSPGTHCTAEQLDTAEALLAVSGRVVRVEERQMDAVTAVSGSGPAYLFYVADAMIEAGVHLGLSRDVAAELATQTLTGAALMLRETGESAVVLRERVTSPAGTTAAALRTLDDRGVRAAFLAAVEAARDRSLELSGN